MQHPLGSGLLLSREAVGWFPCFFLIARGSAHTIYRVKDYCIIRGYSWVASAAQTACNEQVRLQTSGGCCMHAVCERQGVQAQYF